ncbi:MAG: hypothetical protein IPQ13_03370 [Holophagaceae bacterium]|nr:hypothetical protein [Holophagaceae bacterium]
MRVEDLQVVVRPRPPLEAVDLGFLLLKKHARAVFLPWFLALAPLAALLLALFWKHPGWAFLALWWLKPALDRLPLFVLSQATFGQVPGPMETLKRFFGGPRTGLIASLTWRRFAPGRAMSLPLWQLEGLKRAAWRRRWSVMARHGGGSAAMLMLACLHFDLILQMAFLGLVAMLVPNSSDWNFFDWLFNQGGSGPAPGRLLFVAAFAGTGIIEPFYVAGGFGLYLVRRAELEGWDIELAFRALAQRISKAGVRAVLQAALVFTLASGTLIADGQPKPPPATAAQGLLEPTEPTPGMRPESQAKRQIAEIMQRKEFGEAKEIKVPQWLFKKDDPKEKRPKFDFGWIKWLGESLAPFLKGIFIALLFAAVAWVLWHFRSAIGRAFRQKKALQPPDALFGLDMRPENLPEDVPAASWSLWREGRRREALALLYRGALVALVHTHLVELGIGSTEGDCLRAAGDVLGKGGQAYFGALTKAWLLTAYRHTPPEDGLAQRLCADWREHFQRGGP